MKLTSEMKKLIAESGPGLVATASKSGKPNVSAKGTYRVLDDEHVGFADVRSPRTISNLKENPQVSVISMQDRKGVRIWGKAEVVSSGPEFDAVAKEMAARDRKILHFVKIAVDQAETF